jgi:hypothetical protein
VLERYASTPTDVFVVWEPILATDFSRPARWALSSVPDRRARQYWDPQHLIAKRLAADARPPQPAHECCTHGDILWDLIAVYRPGATWTERMPPAVVFNGPVVDVTESVEAVMRSSKAVGTRGPVGFGRPLLLPPEGGR